MWEGDDYVWWDLGEGDGDKSFKVIRLESFEWIYGGRRMYVSYWIKGEDEYDEIGVRDGGWEGYFRERIDVEEEGV